MLLNSSVIKKRFALNAYAGAGKTSTLALMANTTKRRGLYLAFNRAIAQEAKDTFPSHVTVKTSHALAFHAVRQRGYSKKKMTGFLNENAIASIVDIQAMSFDGFELSEIEMATAVRTVVKRFTHSVETKINGLHVERLGIFVSSITSTMETLLQRDCYQSTRALATDDRHRAG